MTHALIIGGGVAGPVTAMALQKAGITAAVYEAYDSGAQARGAFLSLFANGMDALRAIDAERPVLDCSFPGTRVEFVNGRGKRLGTARLDRDAHGELPGPRTMRRADLYRALREEAERRGIRIEDGKRLRSATTTPRGRVVADFTDGTFADGDLLIGADGIHSVTREVIDPANPKPRYTGQNIVCGYTHRAPVSAPPQTYRMVYGQRAFFAHLTTPAGQTWWFTSIPGPELTREHRAELTPEQWRWRAVQRVRGDKGPAQGIIESTGDDVIGISVYDIASTPTWHTPSMIVIGDAAHAAAPNAGHGAALALEDGVVLAQCLRDLPDPARAFTAFEHLRRARVERLVALSAGMTTRALPAPMSRVVRDLMLPRLLKKGPRNTAPWLTRHHIEWGEGVGAGEG